MSVSSKGSVAISVNPGSTGTGSDELTLTTNCSSGYAVYASATSSSASTSLSNGSSEISASSNTLASPGALNDNTWGIANASNYAEGKFAGLPTYANYNVAALTSGDSAASSSEIPVYYGVKVSSDITPGTYTGNVLYTAMVNSNCYTYTISYNANGGSGTMEDQELPMNTETALTSNTFARDGYTFLGWSTDSSAAEAAFTDAQLVTSADFNLAEDGSTKTLYAVWKEDTIAEMQNWTGCSNLYTNQIVAVIDTRNNVKYEVKKMPDNKCWMVEDLRLTPGDSDPGENAVTSGTFAATVADSQSAGTIAFASTTGTNNDVAQATYVKNSGMDKYHAYYTWKAAKIACPAGWHLPISGLDASNEFYVLASSYSGTTWSEPDANNNIYSTSVSTYNSFMGTATENDSNGGFIASGAYSRNGYGEQSAGFYWSASEHTNSSNAYALNLSIVNGSARVIPRNYHQKYYGFSVRCVAEIDGVMQNWTGCDNLNANEVANLLDTRNNVAYKVKKIVNDSTDYSECWMAENLRLTPLTTDPGASKVTSGTLTTTVDTSQAAGSITFSSSGFNSSAAGLRAVYRGTTTYGAYYTWAAAQVVCPAGWHLPTSFRDLDVALGDTGTSSDDADIYHVFTGTDLENGQNLAFLLAGFYNGSVTNAGTDGYYWSSVKSSNIGGYGLHLYSGGTVNPRSDIIGYNGRSVRCAAK